jgi:IPT/TIG domain
MKRPACGLLFFLCASMLMMAPRISGQTIKLVQHGTTDNASANTTAVVVKLSGVASGDLLTCSLTSGASAATTFSVSDSVNGAWSVASSVHYNPGIGQTTAQFYLANSKAGNATITGTSGSAGEYEAMNCQEWSGVATTNPLDQGTQQDGTAAAANPSSGSVTTTSGGELILGDQENVNGPAAGSGFTLINNTPASWLSTEYEIQGSAGAIAATWTAPANGYGWTAQVATFKAAVGGGGTPSPSITSLSPNTGAVGTVVTITGANFGTTQGTSTVKFNGTAGTPTSWSATSIVVPAPSGTTTGNVVVTVGGTASNGINFTVASGSIKLVQHGTTDNASANTTAVVVKLSGVASGDLLTCSLTSGASAATTFSVSDSVNGAWSVASSVHYNPGIGQTTAQFYLANSKAGNATITGTSGSAGEYEAMNCQEWSGVATTNPLDQGTQQDGTAAAANPSSGSVTTTSGGELILGDQENVNGPAAGSGFTLINNTPASWLSTEYEIQGSAGAIAATWTAPANGYGWTAQVATFKAAVGGGGTPSPSITSLSPNTGAVGTVVTITGANFGTTQGTSTVKFNGTAGTPTSWSATSIVVPAPSGTTTGNVVVTVGGTASNGINFTVASGSITVSISPVRAGLTVTQTLSVTATTNDSAGVTWSATGGTFSALGSLTGVAVTYTAPSTAGTYTVTATSATDIVVSASFTVGVTNLAGVYTYHDDLARDGANTQEYALTTSNVNTSSFGKLFSCSVDGAIYAQPLWVANLTISGVQHNVVFVATQHDSLYAFDADANPCVQLWHVSLIDTNHGGTGSETSVPSGPTGNLVGKGFGDITPEVGVTGTPVIDPTTSTLYVVSKSVITSGPTFYQRLHAIDLATGNEKPGAPEPITKSSVTYPGKGDGGTTVSFNPQQENQRAGLALVNGVIYIAWAAHEDDAPYYGWVVGYTYNGLSFTQSSVLNVTPNTGSGGIWMSGGAPSADANNDLYVITGNGTFDVTNASAPNNDYGDSFLQTTPGLAITSYFTPSDEASDAANDQDFGAGGAAVVVNLNSGNLKHLVIGGGKDGSLYLLNGDSMGGLGDSTARQHFNIGYPIFATGAFWNDIFYVAGKNGPLLSYAFNTSTNLFSTLGSQSSSSYGFPGATPSVSSNGESNGIVWALNNADYCTKQSPGCGPTVLHAYNASSLTSDLWNSSLVSTDAAGNAVKFTVPTVANGKVYVGTRGNNTGGVEGSTSVSGELDVYGLKPN